METNVTRIEHAPPRPTTKVSIRDVFKIDVPESYTIEKFDEPGVLTPPENPHHHFPQHDLVMMLLALRMRDTTYIVGPSGSGKTELVLQIAARLNYNVIRVNFDDATRVAELMGQMAVRDGATIFDHGLIPYAYTLPGTILLLDEVDMCPPGVASCLQSAISSSRDFLIRQTGQLFSLHSQNIVVATANTKGMGDDSSLYAPSTNVQNFSFLNRFETTLILDYLPPAVETKMLQDRFCQDVDKPKRDASGKVELDRTGQPIMVKSPQVDPNTVAAMVKVANAVRDGFKNNSLPMPLTTRDLINWLRKYTQMPLPMQTAEYSFLHRFPDKDARSIAAVIKAHFMLPKKDSTKYLGV